MGYSLTTFVNLSVNTFVSRFPSLNREEEKERESSASFHFMKRVRGVFC